MAISRLIKCDVCGREEFEVVYGVGWPGWGHLAGATDDKAPGKEEGHITLCPDDLAPILELLESRRRK